MIEPANSSTDPQNVSAGPTHVRRDSRQAIAVKAWLVEQEPGLAEEIYLDLDPHAGIRPGARWKQALQQANAHCEAVICPRNRFR
jgi:hypothetical protein